MQPHYAKAALAAAWILTACAGAVVIAPSSPGVEMLVATLGLLPPMLMLRRWDGPAQTLSESIQAARR